MKTRKLNIAIAALALLIGPLIFWAVAEFARPTAPDAYSVPGLDPMSPQEARDELFTLLPALLLVVYEAFGKTDEADIYDTLAMASAEEALEGLYLERAGAMVGGGLTEADQTIHEMRLVDVASQQYDETFDVDAAWEVIGTVGHSEHLHVRGNTYRANLTIKPAQGAWKITDFELVDVDRQTAGEFFEAD